MIDLRLRHNGLQSDHMTKITAERFSRRFLMQILPDEFLPQLVETH